MGFGSRTLTLVGTLHATSVAGAAPCAPTAQITGEPDLVATVTELLVEHGVTSDVDGCPLVKVRIERRGASLLVVRIGEREEERVVSGPATAATVIESWSRSDFERPLLLSHPLLSSVPATASAAPPRETVVQTQPYDPHRGVEVFAAAESSFANDQTTWMGAVLGVCVPLGRACASARGRVATVVDGEKMGGEITRRSADVLFGGDIPFAFGRTTVSVGFAAGMGAVHTGKQASGVATGSETFGLRADVHLTWAIQIRDRWSLDLSAALDAAQVTDVEGSLSLEVAREPRIFGRLGAGLRFGAP